MAVVICGSFIGMKRASAKGDAAANWKPSSVGNTTGWSGVEVFRNGTAYASLGANGLLESADWGRSWQPTALPKGVAEVTRMSFASFTKGYISDGNDVYRTTDSASSWTELPTPPGPEGSGPSPFIDGLEAVPGTGRVVASGWTFAGSGCDQRRTDHAIYRFRGGEWRTTTLPYPASVYEIEFLDSKNGLILAHKFEREEGGSDCNHVTRTAKSFVLLTRDGGRTFKKIHVSAFVDEHPVMAVAMPTEDRIVLGLRDGSILISRNGGRSFRPSDGLSGAPSGRLDALDFSSPDVGYAGSNGIGAWRTTDGGRTWAQEPSPFSATRVDNDNYRGSIAAVGRRKAVASGPGSLAYRDI